MKERKRIALLVGQPEEDYQKLFIQGFLEQGFLYNYDVCIFAMYQKYQESQAREIGESHIFSLIQYELFDAFVVLLDTIQTPQVADRIEQKLKDCFSGPVICVDKQSKYFPTVMTDHYTPTKKLITHLIEEHGFRDIAYITGKKWHPHSKQRLQGFLDCMEEHHIEVLPNRIYYGDFWYTSGANVVELLMKDPEHLPEAIACANDCMAIGVATELTKRGIRIPEDIAVIGYDSIEEGRKSPKPITSAPIPARLCGNHVARSVDALFHDQDMPPFQAEVPLFIGSSCGCHNESVIPSVSVRSKWETDISSGGFYSCFNHIMEDMLSQSEFKGLMNTIFSYVYQIREFDSFHICLNEEWNDLEDTERVYKWQDYSDRMIHILRCGKTGMNQDKVDFEDKFDRSCLLPELYEDRKESKAFIFTPLHFEERCFGYAVLSYGNEARSYTEEYRLWIRSVMQGLECFRRIEDLERSNRILETNRIRDDLTGFYNYKGFMSYADSLIREAGEQECYLSSLVIDICNLDRINSRYGREAGNEAIITIANIIEKYSEDGMVCGLGNGEFAITVLSESNDKKRVHAIGKQITNAIQEYNRNHSKEYVLSVYTGSKTEKVEDNKDLERLLSGAVSQKNGNKATSQKAVKSEKLTEEEKKEAETVKQVLDDNRLRYYFQPIVNARNGEVFAYEALMRPDVKPFLSPLIVLKYAEGMNRLYDVEKATFFNVLQYMREHREFFEGRKVFVNSIPGKQLVGADKEQLRDKMGTLSDALVVELTEQTEISDEQLAKLKEDYRRMGIETAVDDYGTGYSNITNLLRYMPNYVKIDRMLLTEIQNSPQKQHFVNEIVKFAHDNDIMALAEGIETEEELRTVIELDVDLIQGYYTARPAAQPVQMIDAQIKAQIIKYRHVCMRKSGTDIYIAGRENRVSTVKVASQKYRTVLIPSEGEIHRDIIFTGTPGLESQLDLRIEDGYHGRIELDNIHFTARKKQPCIAIGDNCDVVLVLKGENVLKNGGIRVPESSKLTLMGNGNVTIVLCDGAYYAIGNDYEHGHGILEFEQDGDVIIEGDVMRGIGIGSGLGGQTYISRGKYVIALNGVEGVGIGAINGDMNLPIHNCNVEIRLGCSKGVAIGTLNGKADISMEHILVKCTAGGSRVVAIGTLDGEESHVSVESGNIWIHMRGDHICGIGSEKGDTSFSMSAVGMYIKNEGKEAIVLGNRTNSARIRIYNSGIDTKLRTNSPVDIGAREEAIEIINGNCDFEMNGHKIERICKEGDL